MRRTVVLVIAIALLAGCGGTKYSAADCEKAIRAKSQQAAAGQQVADGWPKECKDTPEADRQKLAAKVIAETTTQTP